VHGIRREKLAHTEPAVSVARRYSALLAGATIVSDGPEVDAHWLGRLLELLPLPPSVELFDFDHLLRITMSHEAQRAVYDHLGGTPSPHRAGDDAARLAAAWLAGLRHSEAERARTRHYLDLDQPDDLSGPRGHARGPAEGLPLGLTTAKVWSRDKFKGTAALKRRINPTRVPIDQKESVRWFDNLCRSTELIGALERYVHIEVRESDTDPRAAAGAGAAGSDCARAALLSVRQQADPVLHGARHLQPSAVAPRLPSLTTREDVFCRSL
jgi:hypothetical protein